MTTTTINSPEIEKCSTEKHGIEAKIANMAFDHTSITDAGWGQVDCLTEAFKLHPFEDYVLTDQERLNCSVMFKAILQDMHNIIVSSKNPNPRVSIFLDNTLPCETQMFSKTMFLETLGNLDKIKLIRACPDAKLGFRVELEIDNVVQFLALGIAYLEDTLGDIWDDGSHITERAIRREKMIPGFNSEYLKQSYFLYEII